MSFDYNNKLIKKYMLEGHFGIEKESLRVTAEGLLSHTKHPFMSNPNIDRDFCENQVEMITDVCDSVDDVFENLIDLHRAVISELLNLETGKELLWPFSNPPVVMGEEDIPIARYNGDLKGKELYRKYLAKKYGKKKMLFSGIHLNFSFSENFIRTQYNPDNSVSYSEYKNSIYLELAKKITKYSWLIVYLTASSPIADGSLFNDEDYGKAIATKYSSVRCSEIGYWNDFIPLLNYETLDKYADSIQSYIDDGQFESVSELYYPVRLKPAGNNTLENLRESGIDHIELRMFDVNPLSFCGIMKEDILFSQLLILYLMSFEDENFGTNEQISAINNIKKAAFFDDNTVIETGWYQSSSVKAEALNILTDMENFYSEHRNINQLGVIKFQKDKVLKPDCRYAAIVKKSYGSEFVKSGLKLANKYAAKVL